jgi:hypothetical protein
MRHFVLYPFLFGLFIILDLVSRNLDQVDALQIARPSILFMALAAALILAIRSLVKDIHRAAFLTFLIFSFLFAFGHLNYTLQSAVPSGQVKWMSWLLLIVWGLALAVAGSRRMWALFKNPAQVTLFLNVLFLVLLVYPTFTILDYLFSRPVEATSQPPVTLSADQASQPLPDIYILIVDGYGRQDVLLELYGLDNSPFVRFLEGRGFYVASQSSSNYVQTPLSASATLNFAYFDDWRGPMNNGRYRQYIAAPVQDNRLFQSLKPLGYSILAFDSGFSFTNLERADVYLSPFSQQITDFESLMLANSPLDVLANTFGWELPSQSYRAHRQRIHYIFKELSQIPDIPGPKLVFAHILAPHPPFVFDQDGNPVQPDRPYSIFDATDFKGTPQEYVQGYGEQLLYTNKLLAKSIDDILSKSPTPPIILLQGDHGPGSQFRWYSLDYGCAWERTAILNAYYFPGGRTQMLYPYITPVNSFRAVLDTFFAAQLEMLPDRTYFSNWREPPVMNDITDAAESRALCTLP